LRRRAGAARVPGGVRGAPDLPLRRRPVRARPGPGADPAARKPLLPRRAERRGAVGVQRGRRASRADDEPAAGARRAGPLNLFDELPEVENRAGYARRERRLGDELGATLWGTTVYELAPGERVCPYHWHFGEEEWLLVVTGTPTLRTPEG